MTTDTLLAEFARLSLVTNHEDRAAMRYNAVAYITPEEFAALFGHRAEFSRPDGLTEAEGYGEPVSVVYSCHPLTGQYQRVPEKVSYSGRYPFSGPRGGVQAPSFEPVTIVVTRELHD